MYLMSTEKAVRLGERKDKPMSASALGTSSAAASQCQKCFQTGHWTYECKNERVYISRPSKTQQLKNPNKLRMKPSLDPDDKVESRSNKGKRKHRSNSASPTDSEASVFETDSGSESSGESSSEYTSSSHSEEERRRRRNKKKKQKQKQRKERRRRYRSSRKKKTRRSR